MSVRGKDSTTAFRFGISKDALSEIEETVYKHLDSEALRIGGDPVWQELRSTHKQSALRGLLADNVARETAFRLRPLFLEAASEYAEMLTRTIVDHHQQGGQPVHWKAIADRTVEFCAMLTCWEKSARWLYGPLKAVGLGWKDVTPHTRPAYLTALSAWMLVGPRFLPPLSNEPRAEGLPDLLTRKIRHIVRLAPERKPTRRQSHDLTLAMIASVKRSNPGASIERICQLLDAKRVPLPKNWKDCGFKTWHETWKSPEHRNRVKRYISGVVEPASREKEQQFVR